MSARDFYLKQEAKRGFRDWTVDGLEFLLRDKNLDLKIKTTIKTKLKISHSTLSAIDR